MELVSKLGSDVAAVAAQKSAGQTRTRRYHATRENAPNGQAGKSGMIAVFLAAVEIAVARGFASTALTAPDQAWNLKHVTRSSVLSSASGVSGLRVLSAADLEIERGRESASEESALEKANKQSSVLTVNVLLGQFGQTGCLVDRHVEIQRRRGTETVCIRLKLNHAREKVPNPKIV